MIEPCTYACGRVHLFLLAAWPQSNLPRRKRPAKSQFRTPRCCAVTVPLQYRYSPVTVPLPSRYRTVTVPLQYPYCAVTVLLQYRNSTVTAVPLRYSTVTAVPLRYSTVTVQYRHCTVAVPPSRTLERS